MGKATKQSVTYVDSFKALFYIFIFFLLKLVAYKTESKLTFKPENYKILILYIKPNLTTIITHFQMSLARKKKEFII